MQLPRQWQHQKHPLRIVALSEGTDESKGGKQQENRVRLRCEAVRSNRIECDADKTRTPENGGVVPNTFGDERPDILVPTHHDLLAGQ